MAGGLAGGPLRLIFGARLFFWHVGWPGNCPGKEAYNTKIALQAFSGDLGPKTIRIGIRGCLSHPLHRS